MIIETKYNQGDNVWYLDTDNKPFPKVKEMCIKTIWFISYADKSGGIYYNGWETENWDLVPEKLKEEHLFLSKEELLKSL